MTSPIARQRTELRDWFRDVLLAREPRSVLDVGAGRGQLVAALRAAGVQATGVEPDPAVPGLVAAHATALPFDDDAVDWVTLRHVPHHLPDPAAAIAEACRVARLGVLLAEPSYDPTLPGQARGLAIDRALKALDRAAGRTHAEAIPPSALARMLPGGWTVTEVLARHPLRPWTPADFDAEWARSTARLDREPPAAHDRLRAAVVAGQATLGGSAIVAAQSAPSP